MKFTFKFTLVFLITFYIAGCNKTGKEITTASGLKYIDTKEGSGNTPTKGKEVSVLYICSLPDGKVVDSNTDKNNPLKFKLGSGEMIPGFDEGVSSMKVGGKRKLTVPSNLAWGADGAGDAIPPNATVNFEIELIDAK